jgi:hypothetical protein
MTAFGPQSANRLVQVARPAPDATATGLLDTWFQDCTSAAANDGTVVSASWLNTVTAQLRTAVRTAGITLNEADDTMLYDAIVAIAAAGGSDTSAITIDPATNAITHSDGAAAPTVTQIGPSRTFGVGNQPVLPMLGSQHSQGGVVYEYTLADDGTRGWISIA